MLTIYINILMYNFISLYNNLKKRKNINTLTHYIEGLFIETVI